MTLDGLKRNLRGTNDGGDFDPEILETLYNEIKAKPFELNFVKISPGYEIDFDASNKDPVFEKLNSMMGSSEKELKNIIPEIGNTIKATISKAKPWLAFFTGYEGTINLVDEKTNGEANIQIYNPGYFSKLFFGEQSRVIVQPGEVNKESIDLAAKLAATFKTPISSIKATYDFEQKDLKSAYDNEKKNINIEQTIKFKRQVPREPQIENPDIENTNSPR